jgi:alkanesulfonate monooxygenase SsuD/methylene tetrahydromethanopterin reductase-like flavin-dependent oxidoreductase (luciferase family)
MKFGLTFSLQVPPGSGISWQQPYRDMLDCLPRAEDLGYSSSFQVSHHAQKDGLCPGPLIACAAAATVTRTMRIGTGVLLVPLYAPMKLAEDVAVLDNLSGGRFVFGVAPGYVAAEFEAHGVPREERVGRFEEALDLMTLAWTADTFSFDGQFFKVPETRLTPKPAQSPHPPIWYGVSARASLRRAARRKAIQIMSPRHGPEELTEHYEPYEAEAARLGWTIPERPIMRSVFIAETKEKAESVAAPALNYLFTELYGAASAAGERTLKSADGSVITDKTQVGFENFKNRYIIGDPEFAVEQLKLYQKAVNPTEVACWMHLPGISGPDAMRSVELFAREVMPHFA